MRTRFLGTGLGLALAVSLLHVGCRDVESPRATAPRLIAHAGGAIEGATYTNVLEALETGYGNGHRDFELDLSFTSDRKLVLIHDWEETYRDLFEDPLPRIPTLAEFEALTMRNGWHQLTLSGLLAWLERRPDARVVTDIKLGNLEALELIRDRCEDCRTRFLPQVYSIDEFAAVRALGYERIILTLYRTNASNNAILNLAESEDVYAFTMTPHRGAYGDLGRKLKARDQIVYYHTINSEEEAGELAERGAHGFYTDTLVP